MKILKPDNLALVYRSLRFAQRNSLAIGMIAGFRFGQTGLAGLLPENEFWPVVTQALGRDAILDEGYPKPVGEYKVYGAAHAPAGTRIEQQRVGVRIGALAKTLVVSGERHFDALGLISAPQPYARMPIEPATAFGGAGCADNPLGKGFAEIVGADGTRSWPLPNVEGEARRLASRGERIAPAGFWGFDIAAPLRQQHLGTCDERWLEREWPHLPSDARPELFVTAPLDQRLSGYFAGDERFEIDNMHPHARRLDGALPALRARCFVNAHTPQGDVLSEVRAVAETVWLFPELECGAVLYRALAAVADADASDVLHVMAEWEPLGETPLTFEHYRDSFRQAVSVPVPGASAAPIAPGAGVPPQADAAPAAPAIPGQAPQASAPTPAPASSPAPLDAPPPAVSEHLASAHALADALNADSHARMRKYGLSEADLARFMKAPEPERVHTLPEVEKMAAQLQAEARERMRQHNLTDADVARFMQPQPPQRVPSLAEIGKMSEELNARTRALMQQHNLTEADLARLLPAQTLADLGGVPSLGAAPAADFAELAALLPPSAPAAPEASPAAAAQAGQAAAPAVAALTREDVVARHAAKQSLAGYDLSGLDLSGLDLSGADFSGTTLDKVSFAKSRLDGVDFTRALLRETDFTEAVLQRAQLAKASAAAGKFANADLRGAQLAQGDFTGADFSASQLESADLRGAVFDGARLAGVNASACQAEHASFTGCDLGGANFSRAALAKASFSGSRLGGGDFSGANCRQAEFYGTEGRQAIFIDTDLSGSRADAGTCFDDARFTRTRLNRACWDGVRLSGAVFDQAVLDDADLSNAQAQAAQFGASSAKRARLPSADLSGANLDAVNLFGGSLRHANLTGARLRFANLYGVDFDGTRPTVAMLEGANIDRTLLQFRPPVV